MNLRQDMRTQAIACMRACARSRSGDRAVSGLFFLSLMSKSYTTASAVMACLLAVIALAAGPAVAQQAYPNKAIRLICPYPPGGSTTLLARLIGQRLTDNWGQSVIVDNRPGGNTVIGTDALAKSAPDGYTILLMPNTHVTLPHLQKNLPYDVYRDFSPIATLTRNELILVVHTSLPVNNLQEFITYAKSKPQQLNSGSAGSGGFTHLSVELFNMMTGAKLQHVPYKGSAPVLTDLIGGQIQLAFTPVNNAFPHVKSGRIKPLAISGKYRNAALPQVPNFTEAGLPDFDVGVWFGVTAPAGTPRAIIDKMSAEIRKMLTAPEIKEKLTGQGMDPYISTPEQMLEQMKADDRRFGAVIKAANIKLEN